MECIGAFLDAKSEQVFDLCVISTCDGNVYLHRCASSFECIESCQCLSKTAFHAAEVVVSISFGTVEADRDSLDTGRYDTAG
jgi:hypothetical protein